MYLIQVPGLGFIHQRWKNEEPRFCSEQSKAKSWETLNDAVEFGNQNLTPRIKMSWELWQDVEGELKPIIRPKKKPSYIG